MSRGTTILRATKPMNRGEATLKRATKPMAAVGARGKRMRQGKVSASVIEASWMNRAQASGCIVCWLQYGFKAVAEIHHIKEGDRRMGHLFTLPLCGPHHRTGGKVGLFISRHPWKTRFEAAYGTELQLLEEVKLRIGFEQEIISAHQ